MSMQSIYHPDTYQSIRSRVNELTMNHSKIWGKMELPQMMAHLRKVLEIGINPSQKSFNLMGMILGPFIKKMVLNEKPYKEGLPTGKNMIIKNDRDFEQEKSKLLATLDLFYKNGGEYAAKIKHPLFGKLNADEWGFCQWKHFEHHLRQFGG